MKAFVDTSVLVATFYADHQYHERSMQLYSGLKRSSGATAAHCLAEVYAVVTGMQGRNRVSPHEALLFLDDVRQRLSLITLDEEGYTEALSGSVACGISGGAVYDALIGSCALKTKAQALYTWNVRHFQRLGAQIAARVREP